MSGETQSTADVLRGWAAEADESMAQALLALAQHADNEVAAAKAATEAAVLGIVVEAFEAPVQTEAFAVRNAVDLLRQGIDGSIRANKEFLAERDALRAGLHRLARELGCLPDDHAALNIDACVRRVLQLLDAEAKLAHIRETVTR